ncbi:putative membrane protein [Variovorax boronicumulans]|uniref:hypothetical protein n=1 Tax=Variovorax boronicumulans TaxID=436515 RepID=UPI0024742CD8|nr:hypothetical protein [Variovorax boronicumulans]MDH6170058.1 putative membrane protein [Variovorax boronicumulans]
MVHPIYMAALQRPDLFAKHLANYVALLRESTADVVRGTAAKAVAWAGVGVCALLGIALAGTAAMLGVLYGRFYWVLVAVPVVAFLLALILSLVAMRPVVRKEIQDVAVELEADRRAMDFIREHNR